jgi:uncharacterized protein (TIGR03437 family)
MKLSFARVAYWLRFALFAAGAACVWLPPSADLIARAAAGAARVTKAKPITAKPITAKPVQARPVQARPVQARPVQARPVQARPVQARPVQARPVQARVDDATRQRVLSAFAQAPLSFEPNCGQAPPAARYVAAGSNYQLRLGARAASLHMQLTAGETVELGLQFLGAHAAPPLEALDQQPGTTSYVLDNGQQLHRLPNYARVRYRELYPGVDLIFYGNQQRLEYDFVLAPGADPRVIRLAFPGAERVQVAANGDLVLHAAGRAWRQRKPVVYQERNGRRVPVAGRYVRRGQSYGIALGRYERSAPLVIDPVLDYARHWLAPADLTVDDQGNVYLAGGTSGFWVSYMNGQNYERLALIIIGSSGSEARAVAADGTGNVYVAGSVTTNVPGYGSLNERPGIDSRLRLILELGNGGNSWNAQLNQENALSLTPVQGIRLRSILINPNDPNILYASDGGATAAERGAQWPLFKRSILPDGGGSTYGRWQSISANLAGLNRLKLLAILPGAQPILFVSTSGGLLKTQNDGATWASAGLNVPGLNSLVFSRQNPQLLYAATATTVYKSSDGGASWTASGQGLPADLTQLELVIDPANSATVYALASAAAASGLYKSTDGGARWQLLPLELSDRRVLALAVNPLETTMLYAGTTRGLSRSLDGGATWQAAGLAQLQVSRITLDPLNPATLYAATPLSAAPSSAQGRFVGGASKSTNGGQSWAPLGLLHGYLVESLVVDPAQPARVLVGVAGKSAAFVYKVFIPADVNQNNQNRFLTYINGPDSQATQDLALDAAGNAYLTGKLLGEILTPEQAGGQGFFIKLTEAGAISSPLSVLAGTGKSLAVDEAGMVYLAGTVTQALPLPVKNGFQTAPSGSHDAFLLKFDPAQTGAAALQYATYLGGSGRDEAVALALNSAQQVYLTGSTGSADFPAVGAPLTTTGNVFVAKLDPSKSGAASLLWSSYFGTGRTSGLAVDGSTPAETLYLVGTTQAADFPATPNALQPQLAGGTCNGAPCADAFVAKLSANGPALIYATLLGAANSAEEGVGPALNPEGKLFFASRGKPPAGTAFKDCWIYGCDGYLGRLDLRSYTVAPVVPLAVTNVSAASYHATPLAAAAITSAFGTNLATSTLAATTLPLPTTLGGTRVIVRDSAGAARPAPLFFVSPNQINYLLPADTAAGLASVTITSASGALSEGTVSIAPVAPGLFTASATGSGLPAALVLRVKPDGAQSFEPIARFDPAQNKLVAVPIAVGTAGEQVYLLLFGTGLRGRSALSEVHASLGGIDAPVTYAGAQGDLAGLDQINVQLPQSLNGRAEVAVTLRVDGQTANPVKVWVK